MIKGNILEFGYGDVAVSSNGTGYIKFTNIKPPLECGTRITSGMSIEYGDSITIYEDEILEFYNLVETVNIDNTVVEYKGYTLDFSNYNEKSVKIVKKNAKNMVNWMVLAC